MLSVIILNYNVRYFLELCLCSVSKSLENLDAEIIVVDNASSDDSIDMVRWQYPNVRILANKQNVGFAKANNQGVKRAQGKYICILNPDTVVPENFFQNLLMFAENTSSLGIIGCKLIDGSGNFLPESKRNIPTVSVALHKFFGSASSYYATHISETETAQIDILVGAMMFMKKKVFNEVQGFDEDYFMYGEDVDLSYKVLQAGYKNFYRGSETIIHFKGESTRKDLTYFRRFYGAMQIFYKKHFSKNLLFDAMVWLGIRIMPFISPSNQLEKIKEPKNIKFIAQEELNLSNPYEHYQLSTSKEVESLEENHLYIFEVNYITFQKIIDAMSLARMTNNVLFRFYLPESKVIIGSDSSETRGAITHVRSKDHKRPNANYEF